MLMSLRVKNRIDHRQMPIHLGPIANPHCVKTYISIHIARHPWANCETELTDADLASCVGCEDYDYYSFMMAQEALTNGLDRQAATKRLNEALDKVYRIGAGVLPPRRADGVYAQWSLDWENKLFSTSTQQEPRAPVVQTAAELPQPTPHIMSQGTNEPFLAQLSQLQNWLATNGHPAGPQFNGQPSQNGNVILHAQSVHHQQGGQPSLPQNTGWPGQSGNWFPLHHNQGGSGYSPIAHGTRNDGTSMQVWYESDQYILLTKSADAALVLPFLKHPNSLLV